MARKLTALVAVLATMVLAAWGSGAANAAPAKIPLGGGSGIYVMKSKDMASSCTLTTIGRAKKTNKLIGITAGHCGERGQYVLSEKFTDRGIAGVITYSAQDIDIAVIEFDEKLVTPLRKVQGVAINGIDARPLSFPTIACKQGRTTGNTCGIAWFSKGHEHYSQICIVEGDSGSPVVVGDKLVGMVNAYYTFGCIGTETGTNIGPILTRVAALPSYGGFRTI
ncbi:serine protease [Gordonia pseudamarae]|jgi:hypothetical protein|uniref:Serine protease n=1 Tax=Gordonia pseudamarae TaxID=2831662 RepID=A0ABX6IJ35_9ACTN|nr:MULTISPECIES: serine protease [Gordonia]MBD0024194.1 serine protease [Gordonia sp. (in: high G+C Gram-positive bacteria)]QHN27014.1 serine protease [Gordonia pseudamarae]QHN35903.1 serine protease [Gordonia pseudamarae]